MKVHYGFENLGGIINPVVTTGSFDGVHVGHTVIINKLNTIAKKINGESVLITFHPHPRKVLFPDTAGKTLQLINSQKEKIEHFSKTGLDHLIIVNFTIGFSKVSSIDFIRKYLVDKLRAKYVIVGFNHYFGHNREGNFEFLYELGKYYGFDVEEIPEQDIQNETVSSTKIRAAIKEGYIQKANAYLDHIYNVIGPISIDQNPFAKAGIDTFQILIDEEEKLLPPNGIYAAKIRLHDEYYKGIVIQFSEIENEIIENRYIYFHSNKVDKEIVRSEVEVLFYKQIVSNIDIRNVKDFKIQIQNYMQEVQELIF
jgi:riboflavin kinase / FMN adenylyltransferase